MGEYRTRDAATLLEMPVGQVRACAREGVLEARRDPRGQYRLSFRDMVVLRRARALMEEFPAARVRRTLLRIRRGLPERDLASLAISFERDTIVVRDGALIWEPESGQTRFNFDGVSSGPNVTRLHAPPADPDPEDVDSAEAWFHIAMDLETTDIAEAIEAYRRAVDLDPSMDEGRVNLGRLLHARGELGSAEFQYRKALETNPSNATASFNLGVVLEDLNRHPDAIRAYERTIELDPESADAHYNLYRIHNRAGRLDLALRHLSAYRDLGGL